MKTTILSLILAATIIGTSAAHAAPNKPACPSGKEPICPSGYSFVFNIGWKCVDARGLTVNWICPRYEQNLQIKSSK